MINNIDGVCFINMIDYAVRNLNQHVKLVNQLNVFPVPDGDTGTNMVTTIYKGLKPVGNSANDLPSIAQKFARSVVFEARGNSGVIVSQFLKGISETFFDVALADSALLIEAFEKGVDYAYASVAVPVEGTMLTVIKDATCGVKSCYYPEQPVNEVIEGFVAHAKVSLERTPELLPVLKESGVVDSGGAGIVYLFEGMIKYLNGESIENFQSSSNDIEIDYDAFNRSSRFTFGYCTELLLQLLDGCEAFDLPLFKGKLAELGDSLVVSAENDKVRIHIHSRFPEKVFALCHRYGEFLSCKIENMTVQHTELSKRILCSDVKNNAAFSVVAVAYDLNIQKMLLDMGADIVIYCNDNVSTKDYLDAFSLSNAEHIFVFPNRSDAVLTALQAKKLYYDEKITVLNSRSIAECYAVLPAIDYEKTDIESVIDELTDILENLYVISIATGDSDIQYGEHNICRNDYYSFSGKELITVGKSLEETALQTISEILKHQEKDIITIFYKSHISLSQVEAIADAASSNGILVEFFYVQADSLPCEMIISFE